MVLSRRPEEKSVAAGNGSSAVGLGCCQQNRWPRSGAGLTAAPIQSVVQSRTKLVPTVAWQGKKGMKVCCVGREQVFSLSVPMTVYLSGWGSSNMTIPVRLNFSYQEMPEHWCTWPKGCSTWWNKFFYIAPHSPAVLEPVNGVSPVSEVLCCS